jgi:hypothetical protein
MRRAICVLVLGCFFGVLVGCEGDSVNDNSANVTPTDAKAIADKMPGPDVKTAKKK